MNITLMSIFIIVFPVIELNSTENSMNKNLEKMQERQDVTTKRTQNWVKCSLSIISLRTAFINILVPVRTLDLKKSAI